MRVAHFIQALGPDALKTHNGLPFKSPAERQNMDVIMNLWHNHCVGKVNVKVPEINIEEWEYLGYFTGLYGQQGIFSFIIS